jgi:hypothetical protein
MATESALCERHHISDGNNRSASNHNYSVVASPLGSNTIEVHQITNIATKEILPGIAGWKYRKQQRPDTQSSLQVYQIPDLMHNMLVLLLVTDDQWSQIKNPGEVSLKSKPVKTNNTVAVEYTLIPTEINGIVYIHLTATWKISGMDVNCGSYVQQHGAAALQQGKITEPDINLALHNLFTVRMRLGLFNGYPKLNRYDNISPNQVCTQEH